MKDLDFSKVVEDSLNFVVGLYVGGLTDAVVAGRSKKNLAIWLETGLSFHDIDGIVQITAKNLAERVSKQAADELEHSWQALSNSFDTH